jgi:hypothetical protein
MKATVKIHEEVKYSVYYNNSYCMTYNSFNSALKMVKNSIKYNDNINENYYIFFENENTKILIATVTAH